MIMTYYLIRHVGKDTVDTVPYRADNTREAIRLGIRLHEPRAIAEYAQIQDNHGRIICTLSSNKGQPGTTKVAIQQELPWKQ